MQIKPLLLLLLLLLRTHVGERERETFITKLGEGLLVGAQKL